MDKITLLALMVAILFPLRASRASDAAIVSLADFGGKPDSGQDATPAFQQAIAEARKHPDGVTLRIPKGRYDLFPEKASHRYYFASNAGDGDCMHTIAVDIRGVKRLTIDGQGSLLMMRGKMTLLVAEECENLSINSLTFDFMRPTMSELKISEIGNGYWVGQVHHDSKYELVDGKYVEWIGEGWKARHNLVQAYDPIKNTTWRLGSDPLNDATAVTEVRPGVLRFTLARIPGELKVGQVLQCRDVKRDEVGMWFNHSKDVSLNDVIIRYMHGFGILGQFSENLSFDRLVVAPAKDSGRTCAAFADILHFSMCRGKIVVRDSILSAAHDDAINVHGVYFQVIDHPAANQVLVKFPHAQTWGFQGFFPGDEITYAHKKSLANFGDTKVLAVEVRDPHEQLLTLADSMPKEAVLGEDCIENTTWTPSLAVKNCDVSVIPTRGFLITTRRPVLVENNRFFRIRAQAIVISNDASGWWESGPIRDVTIRGNEFVLGGEPVISVDNANHSGFHVLDNHFILQDRIAFAVNHVKDFQFMGNRIEAVNPPANDRNLGYSDGNTDVVLSDNVVHPWTQ